jgi:hypothetical protein
VRTAGFTVWVTGPDPRALEAYADEIAGRFAARHCAVETFDARTPGIDVLLGEGAEARLALVSGLLARRGVATVIAIPGSRSGRDAARAALGRMIEVHVRHADAAPEARYEAPERPEVEVVLPEHGPFAGIDRVESTLEVLGLLARDAGRAYTEEEEREVIRRLKSFGYL